MKSGVGRGKNQRHRKAEEESRLQRQSGLGHHDPVRHSGGGQLGKAGGIYREHGHVCSDASWHSRVFSALDGLAQRPGWPRRVLLTCPSHASLYSSSFFNKSSFSASHSDIFF